MAHKKTYKILVISDTHGDDEVMNRVVEHELPFDYLFHCGDAQVDPAFLLEHQDEYQLLAVKGNCDSWTDLPAVVDRKIGYYKVAAVHGHRQDVSYGLDGLKRLAREISADVMLFGHTHQAMIKRDANGGTLYVNPGSLTRNRPYSKKGTYAVLTISEDALPEAELFEV